MAKKKIDLLNQIKDLENTIITLDKNEISNITNIIGENLNDKSEEELLAIVYELEEIIKKLKSKCEVIENPTPEKPIETNGNKDISKKTNPPVKKITEDSKQKGKGR